MRAFRRLLAFSLLISCTSAPIDSRAETTLTPIVVNQSAAGATPNSIGLKISNKDAEGGFTGQSRQVIATAPTPDLLAAVGDAAFTAYLDLGAQPDGNSYFALLRPEQGPKYLTNNGGSGEAWRALIGRKGADGNVVKLNEGLLGYGEFPIPFTIDKGVTTPIPARVVLNLNGRSNDMPSASVSVRGGREATGSVMLSNAKLAVTVDLGISHDYSPDMTVSYRLEPFDTTKPQRTASGRISDIAALGKTTVAVGTIAPDFSSISILTLAGKLEDVAEGLAIGSRMPSFAQVELFDRRTISWHDVLKEAERTGFAVMVFGDVVDRNPQYGYGNRSGDLPLDRNTVVDTISAALPKQPKVIFVTREFQLKELFDDQRNKRPEYWVLSDYASPMRTQFVSPSRNGGGYMYGYPGNSAEAGNTLRSLLSLPDDMISVLVFDAAGSLIYLQTVKSQGTLGALTGANEAMRSAPAKPGT